MSTISVFDSGGSAVAIEKPLTPGRAAAAASRPVVLSNEDLSVLEAIDTALTNPLTVNLPSGAATAAKQPALGTAGTPSADVITVQGASAGIPLPVNTDSTKAAYSAGTNGQTPGASPNDLVVIKGSSTKTVKIRRIRISGEATTAGSMRLFLIRRSTAASGGTANAITPAQHDSANAAATATVTFYTAAPTPGTSVSTIAGDRLDFPLAGTYEPVEFDFGSRPIVLRGTSEFLAVSVSGTLPTGAVFEFHVEFTEE